MHKFLVTPSPKSPLSKPVEPDVFEDELRVAALIQAMECAGWCATVYGGAVVVEASTGKAWRLECEALSE